ncbi:MAG: 6-carboxytetrahydropterin synthase [Lachnospiraceae bacterium]|nr:6-carboxytetrahydropterin synthase [Lachnospiraceae bacterium]
MDIKIFREYRLKFYLNARHYIIVGNEKSDTHPHTWELALTILIRKKEFIKFGNFETKIEEYFSKYQDRVLNEIAPFNAIIPTLENMVDYFANDIYKIIKEVGGELVCLEGSEGPSRSYILNLREENESMDAVDNQSENILSDIIDTILDDIID